MKKGSIQQFNDNLSSDSWDFKFNWSKLEGD